MNLSSYEVIVTQIESVPSTLGSELAEPLRETGITVRVETLPDPGPYAALEWLIPTAIALFFVKPYAEGFLKKMGEDHYAAIKRVVSETAYPRLLDASREVNISVVGTPGKVREHVFNLAFSLEAPLQEKTRIRLLFREGASVAEAQRSIEEFFRLLEAFAANKNEPLVRILRRQLERHGWVNVVYFDAVTDSLKVVDVLRSAREKKLLAFEDE